jgi:CubicO group peptidase (beta-lactamase class C family)
MTKRLFVGLLSLAMALASVAAPPASKAQANDPPIPNPKWLRQELERARAKYQLPGLAACLVVGDKVVAASAVGHRKLGSPTPATPEDRFCVGSVSKPMTSTLVGALVEKKVLGFDDTLETMFPELVPRMQPGYRKVTVRMLLAHTSGMPGDPKKVEPRQPTPDDLNQAMAHRYQYVCNAVVDPPLARPGEKNIYGGSCVIVVSYLERKLKKPYEELMEQYVFRPLGMATAGKFVMVSGPDALDGPWPHELKDGRYTPVPLLIGRGFSRAPAGGVCLSIGDLGKWASAHLQGENGHSNLLRSRTFRELHRLLPGVHTTMSFGRQPAGWADAEVLWHSGAHVGISAAVNIVPAHNYAIGLACNCNGKDAGQAQREVRDFLVKRAKAMRSPPASSR